MTREKAIRLLTTKRAQPSTDYQMAEVYTMAIKALSQEPICDRDCEHCTWTECPIEPCDNAISRDMALEKMADYVASGYADSSEDFAEYSRIICQLPSVTQKSGKWINDKNDIPICSRCGYIPQFDRAIDDYEYSNYCPSCGCRMVEPQESEDKE